MMRVQMTSPPVAGSTKNPVHPTTLRKLPPGLIPSDTCIDYFVGPHAIPHLAILLDHPELEFIVERLIRFVETTALLESIALSFDILEQSLERQLSVGLAPQGVRHYLAERNSFPAVISMASVPHARTEATRHVCKNRWFIVKEDFGAEERIDESDLVRVEMERDLWVELVVNQDHSVVFDDGALVICLSGCEFLVQATDIAVPCLIHCFFVGLMRSRGLAMISGVSWC